MVLWRWSWWLCFGCLVDCASNVVYDPYGFSLAWTILLLWPASCDDSMV
jgi:hypothetical protein